MVGRCGARAAAANEATAPTATAAASFFFWKAWKRSKRRFADSGLGAGGSVGAQP